MACLHGITRRPRRYVAPPEETALSAWVDAELELGASRRDLVARALYLEGLTLPRINAAAECPGAFQVLLDLFAFSEAERSVELTRGERLALATAALRDANR